MAESRIDLKLRLSISDKGLNVSCFHLEGKHASHRFQDIGSLTGWHGKLGDFKATENVAWPLRVQWL